MTIKGVVDKNIRLATARNHTATHLLRSLREIPGDHVLQAGSYVSG